MSTGITLQGTKVKGETLTLGLDRFSTNLFYHSKQNRAYFAPHRPTDEVLRLVLPVFVS